MAPPGLRKGHHCAYDLCAYDLCAYDLHSHFVFVVRYRRALLRPPVEAERVRLSHESATRSASATRSTSSAWGPTRAMSICSARPTRRSRRGTSPGSTGGDKSITALQLFKAFPALRKELWGGKFWSDGYFVSNALASSRWETLVRHIKDQGQRPEAVNLRLLFPKADPPAGTGPPADER